MNLDNILTQSDFRPNVNLKNILAQSDFHPNVNLENFSKVFPFLYILDFHAFNSNRSRSFTNYTLISARFARQWLIKQERRCCVKHEYTFQKRLQIRCGHKFAHERWREKARNLDYPRNRVISRYTRRISLLYEKSEDTR